MPRTPNTTCSVCSTPIYRRPNEMEKGPVFCSVICSHVEGKKFTKCPICEKEFQTKGRTYCSKVCANRGRLGIKYFTGGHKSKRYTRLLGLATHGAKCCRCGYSEHIEVLEVHHKVPKKLGGSNEPENLEVLCANCHAYEHYKEVSTEIGIGPASNTGWLQKSHESSTLSTSANIPVPGKVFRSPLHGELCRFESDLGYSLIIV